MDETEILIQMQVTTLNVTYASPSPERFENTRHMNRDEPVEQSDAGRENGPRQGPRRYKQSSKLCPQRRKYDKRLSNSLLSGLCGHPPIDAFSTSSIQSDWKTRAERVLDNTPRQYLDILKGILCWCIGAVEPITKRQLAEALLLRDSPRAEPAMKKEVIGRCEETISTVSGGIIEFDKYDRARFIHEEIRESITSGETAYTVSQGDAQEYLSSVCWQYVSQANFERDLQSYSEDRQSIARYMIKNGITHSRLAESRGRSHTPFLLALLHSDSETLKRWSWEYSKITGDNFRCDELTNSLLFCACFGFYQIAQKLVAGGRVTERDREKARELALSKGNTDIAFLLFPPDAPGTRSYKDTSTRSLRSHTRNIRVNTHERPTSIRKQP